MDWLLGGLLGRLVGGWVTILELEPRMEHAKQLLKSLSGREKV